MTINAHNFLKNGGHFMISIKAICIDLTVPAEAVFAAEVKKLQKEQFKPAEQVTLEPFERDHACVVGSYRGRRKPSQLPGHRFSIGRFQDVFITLDCSWFMSARMELRNFPRTAETMLLAGVHGAMFSTILQSLWDASILTLAHLFDLHCNLSNFVSGLPL